MINKVQFIAPPISDIVIFNRIGSQRIKKIILEQRSCVVVDSKPSIIYINIKIFLYFILNLNFLSIGQIFKSTQIIRETFVQLWRVYLLSLIKVINPKIIITLIDNNVTFHWLCKNYRNAKFIAIQNGNRTHGELNSINQKFFLGDYYCFGEYEKNLFNSLDYKVENYYPIGSLLAGYYINKIKVNKYAYDICVISSWRGNIGNSDDVQISMKSMKKLDKMLARYISETKVRASILMRSEPKSSDRNIPFYGDEKDYFQKIYPESVILIDPDFKTHNIYSESIKANLIISMGSTVIRELYGFGKKVLYCDFTDSNLYNDYEKLILFDDYNYNLFKERIDEILKLNYNDYNSIHKEYASYLMNNNQQFPPHKLIRSKIENHLNKQKN